MVKSYYFNNISQKGKKNYWVDFKNSKSDNDYV